MRQPGRREARHLEKRTINSNICFFLTIHTSELFPALQMSVFWAPPVTFLGANILADTPLAARSENGGMRDVQLFIHDVNI